MAVQRPTNSQARLFAQLLADLQPEIRRGFMASVVDLQAGVNWPALLRELGNSNIEGAIAALNINAAAWAEYSAVVTSAYAKAGASTMAQIVNTGVADIGTRFNMTNPSAEAWIRREVGGSVSGFVAEQVKSARELIAAGYGRGDGPRTIANDLAGRVVDGRRQGGIIGLDAPRAERLQAVTTGMRTPEGVQSLVIKHRDGTLSVRYKVNKSTEARILAAYNAGTEVPEKARLISERQYENALLKARADTIAETETANAVMSARMESWEQVATSKGLDSSAVIKTWRHRRGAEQFFRPDHLAMSGTVVRGLHTPFPFPDGAYLEYAHDPRGGGKHTIKCGCDTEFRLDQAAGLR